MVLNTIEQYAEKVLILTHSHPKGQIKRICTILSKRPCRHETTRCSPDRWYIIHDTQKVELSSRIQCRTSQENITTHFLSRFADSAYSLSPSDDQKWRPNLGAVRACCIPKHACTGRLRQLPFRLSRRAFMNCVCVYELYQLTEVLADLSKNEKAFLVASLQNWISLQIMILRGFQKMKALKKLSISPRSAFHFFCAIFGPSHLSIRKPCCNVTSTWKEIYLWHKQQLVVSIVKARCRSCRGLFLILIPCLLVPNACGKERSSVTGTNIDRSMDSVVRSRSSVSIPMITSLGVMPQIPITWGRCIRSVCIQGSCLNMTPQYC